MIKKLLNMFQKNSEQESWLVKNKLFLIRMLLVVLFSYVLANAMNAMLVPKLGKAVSKWKQKSGRADVSLTVSGKSQLNYHDIKKAVLDRNIFNKSGDFPPESFDDEKPKSTFNMDAPCEKTKLKIKLQGVIYRDDGNSVATIREDGLATSDVYMKGDYIIGSENALVARIKSDEVVLNNEGRKECLQLASASKGASFAKKSQPALDTKSFVKLDAKFIQEELGEGFGKIIQSARMIPNTVDNRVNGFKVFGIQTNTLLDKAGFEENDVITKVNNTVMEADQGFALYQALNDEKEIQVELLRNGKTPKTIVIQVK